MKAQSRPIRKVAMGPGHAKLHSNRAPTVRSCCAPRIACGAFPEKITERLEHWAKVAPERVLFAQRDAAAAGEA